MRQAGRFLPEYRDLRKRYSMLELCTNADLAAQVTMLPIRLLPGLDAAIVFSDLLLPLQPMGLEIRFAASEGPQVLNPIAHESDVERLRPLEPEQDLRPVLDAIRILRRELQVPLIGFAGAPFTLASYAIEGGSSRHYLKTKGLMTSHSPVWSRLMTKLAEAALRHLRAQIEAGAQMVQLFDSWVGALGPRDYEEFVLPYSRIVFEGLRDTGAPTIHFGTGTASLLELMKRAGGDVIGLDWRVNLAEAWLRLGEVAVMGNLDPAMLLAPREALVSRVDSILDSAGRRAGHIFNLGHGVLPETPVENLLAVLERVHSR